VIKRVDIYKANWHIIDDYRAYLNYGNTCSFKKKREVIEMKKFYIIPLILCFFLVAPSCKKAQEEPVPKIEEKVEKESPAAMIEEGEPMVEEGKESEAPIMEEGEEGK
jgi:hypothetical protein